MNYLSVRVFCAALIGVSVLMTEAWAGNTCLWVKKVVAAKNDGFRSLKGEQDLRNWTTPVEFKGTLLLEVAGKARERGCSLMVRRRADVVNAPELPPRYICPVAVETTFAQAFVDYESFSRRLRSCFLKVAFTESRTGSSRDRTENWSLSASIDGAEVSLTLYDSAALAAELSGTSPSDEPGVSVALSVTDNASMPAGSDINVPVMK